MKVIRDAVAGTALGAFGPWSEVIDRAGSAASGAFGSDGDGVIAAGIELVYGWDAPHQLSLLHLLRECWRNIGGVGFASARWPLDATSLAEGGEWARRIMRATAGAARY